MERDDTEPTGPVPPQQPPYPYVHGGPPPRYGARIQPSSEPVYVGGRGTVLPCRCGTSIPTARRGRGYRAAESFGRSPAGQWVARHVSTRPDPLLYRATGGQFTTSMGIVVNAPLVTIGSKSGQPREVQLTYLGCGAFSGQPASFIKRAISASNSCATS